MDCCRVMYCFVLLPNYGLLLGHGLYVVTDCVAQRHARVLKTATEGYSLLGTGQGAIVRMKLLDGCLGSGRYAEDCVGGGGVGGGQSGEVCVCC